MKNIKYKGTMERDKTSKRYKVFKIIDKEYGCLFNFLEDIELQIE